MSTSAADREPIALMQFWDTEVVPPDVAALMATWSSDPQFSYVRYSWESAHEFIKAHHDRRVLAVYESCAAPAMQCDVFRLCWLLEHGGIYIDADQGNRGRNHRFTDTSARGHLFFRDRERGRIINGLMSFFAPNDPLVVRALDRVVINVEQRKGSSVWQMTGPGVISNLYRRNGPDSKLFAGISFHSVLALKEAMHFGVDCEYKSSPRQWSNFAEPFLRAPSEPEPEEVSSTGSRRRRGRWRRPLP